jgi:3-hydroxyacyl-[acyl-carrier-protein] dehydratase
MLSGNFFDIQSLTLLNTEEARQSVHATASLNSNHVIFDGHFPGNPVVPGVCQVQMVKEIIEQALDQSYDLTASDNIKFLLMINPLQHPLLDFNIDIKHIAGNQITATATIGSGTSVFLKFKGKFDIRDHA